MTYVIPHDGPIYMIQRRDRSGFFLFDIIQHEIDIALWTPALHKAREFYIEERVEEFKFQYLSNRPVEIVRVK